MAKYDDREALEILGAFGEGSEPNASSDAKDAAAGELLDAIKGLDQKVVGLAAVRLAQTVWIGFRGRNAGVEYRGGKFLVSTDGAAERELPLVFNRATRQFEGAQFDSSTNPVPGEPTNKRRPALTVVAEVVASVLGAARR